MKENDVIKRLQKHRDIFNKGCNSYQDMQDAINCIIGLKAENEVLKQRLELLAEMENKKECIYRKELDFSLWCKRTCRYCTLEQHITCNVKKKVE